MPEFQSITFGLGPNIAGQEWSLGWIVARATDSQKVFKFDLGPGQVRKKLRGGSRCIFGAFLQFSKSRDEIDVNRLTTQ